MTTPHRGVGASNPGNEVVECPSCRRSLPTGTERCPHDGTRLLLGEASADRFVGTIIEDRYQLLERVGSGGMGSVYRALQLNVGREVAVKIVNAVALQHPETVRRFENEARIISQLHHPSTLKLIDFGKLPDERPYLVTELLRGHSLDVVVRDAPMPVEWTLRVMRQICDSLAEAHSKGIIHRDLKPENIFIEDIGSEAIVRVLDFGIAKLGQGSQTATGTIFGTPAYMSPEQARGATADARSDLYSVGVIGYRCLVGRPPFESEQPLALLLKQIQEIPVPLSKAMNVRKDQLPNGVETLIMALLEKHADRRPSSAVEVRALIDKLLGHTPLPVRTPAHGVPTPTPAPSFSAITPTMSAAPFVGEASDGLVGMHAAPRGGLMKLAGLGFLLLALVIIGGSWMALRDDGEALVEPIRHYESAEPVGLPIPERLMRGAEVEADDDEPPSVEPKADKKKKKPTKSEAPAKTADKPKREKKEAEAETPPGFVDFDL